MSLIPYLAVPGTGEPAGGQIDATYISTPFDSMNVNFVDSDGVNHSALFSAMSAGMTVSVTNSDGSTVYASGSVTGTSLGAAFITITIDTVFADFGTFGTVYLSVE